ncbi:MAG: hypothetical protein D8M57_01505 [Candidatus Scalindua sp. AMX11]|nr:MAG: hypothetical protein DWQ00_15490 [Candidatus Scalindua sp.]TDE66740.1 MAG: hypothetical protein D8M57_01505 [Candidatus Scalindua sp. AMX11]GJQ58051.1 MAG: hypothetical protein SCALA701_08520 [Candidatus Scalindua sp.]
MSIKDQVGVIIGGAVIGVDYAEESGSSIVFQTANGATIDEKFIDVVAPVNSSNTPSSGLL